MTFDRKESIPATGRALFASGIVLGLSLGFAAGHLLLFSRGQRDEPVAQTTDEFPEFKPSSSAINFEPPPGSPADSEFSVMEWDDDPDVGRVTLSEVSPDDGLRYFPEAMPDDEPVGETWLASAAEQERSAPLRQTAELTPIEAVPQALQPAPSAAPIDQRTSRQEELARSIIAEELPQATAQEREIWYEVLLGLPADDIKGILRMKKHLDEERPSDISTRPTFNSPLFQPQLKVAPAIEPPVRLNESSKTATRTIDARLQEIDRHNRANRETVAFKRLVPILVESPLGAGDDVKLLSVTRDMSMGKVIVTGRMLDLAIESEGFFAVRAGEQVRYTRDGRLTMDDQRRLTLLAAEQDWRIDPPITIPEGARRVVIESDGTVLTQIDDEAEPSVTGKLRVVRFLAPDALSTTGGGLYEPTAISGMPSPVPADAIQLRQGHLEASNSSGL